jgi:hypothetical protein
MLKIIHSNLDTLNSIESTSKNILMEGQPIQYFGKIDTAKIATIGLNPSDKEFYSDKFEELTSGLRRFNTLSSLNINNWRNIEKINILQLKYSMDKYFKINPYKRWFNQLENLFFDTGYSYYNDSACHIDLTPYATTVKWSSLSKSEQIHLLKESKHDFISTVEKSKVTAIVLNGSSVINGFLNSFDLELDKQKNEKWDIKTSRGVVAGYSFKGVITLDKRKILVLGYNHNLQSSFGLSKKIKDNLKLWVSSEIKIHDNLQGIK